MDPITEQVLEVVGDRGELGRGEARKLAEEVEQFETDAIYKAFIGPMVDDVETCLLNRKEGNELEE